MIDKTTGMDLEVEAIHLQRINDGADIFPETKWIDKGDRLELWSIHNELLKTKFK